jgi:hypothetical protein
MCGEQTREPWTKEGHCYAQSNHSDHSYVHSHSVRVCILLWHTRNEEESYQVSPMAAELLQRFPREESGGTGFKGTLTLFLPACTLFGTTWMIGV